MKKISWLITIILTISLITGSGLFNFAFAAAPSQIDVLSKSEKYFNNLKLVNDTKRNMSYYVPQGLPSSGSNDYQVRFLKSTPSTDSRLSLIYTNSTLYSQADFAYMPFESSFTPSDTLDTWVTKLFKAMDSFYGTGFHYEIIEKQSNMYIVKYYYGEFNDPAPYSFYKIQNGVPLSMTVSGSGDYGKNFSAVLNEAKTLFANFKPIKSYSQNPNIGFYFVCIGSFKDRANADKLAAQAKAKGIQTNIVSAGGFYRVNIGAFRIKTNAESLQKSAISKGFKDTFLYYEIRK